LKQRNAFSKPGQARRKDPLGHFGKNPVVAEPGERLRIRLRRQQLGESLGPALALLGAGTNGLERGHGGGPRLIPLKTSLEAIG
jgi:hypothetical protein